MNSADNLLGDFASGDAAGAGSTHPAPLQPSLKRDQESTDDFEHLERERDARQEGESPEHRHRTATQSFLDMERDEGAPQTAPLLPARADAPPSASPVPAAAAAVADVADVMEHLADKFTDSESDADTAGESPLHRPAPVAPSRADATPPVTPKAAPVPAPVPSPAPAPVPETIPEIKPAAAPAPAPTPAPPKPSPPKPAEPAPPKPAEPAPPKPVAEPARPTAHIIEAEVIFCQMGLDAWFDPQRLHPEVESLIYWRNAGRSGAALGAGLALLVALACCSVVSVLAYASLLALSAAVAFRVYRNVLQAVQKTNDGHPFKWLLEQPVEVPAERAQALAAAATAHLNAATQELRRLFLVEDLVDSLKFGVLLWCLTYVGACFNGITLIILGWIALFTLPKAYEMNKAQVDANLELARAKINEISAKVRAAVPLGRKAESDKDK